MLASCYRLPEEDRLAEAFASHRAAFDRLLAMSTEDRGYRRISGGELAPRGMAQERYRTYLAVFQELRIENGLTPDLNPNSPGVYILAGSMVPIGGKGRAVGYFYSMRTPATLVSSLGISALPFETGSGQKTVYRRLEGGWYLFYDRSS
jgi:hypothetical protein